MFWLWSTTQHNTFSESFGYAVAIETIQKCHIHTQTHVCMPKWCFNKQLLGQSCSYNWQVRKQGDTVKGNTIENLGYLFLFHPRYLHNTFRYMTLDHDISRYFPDVYPSSYSNQPNYGYLPQVFLLNLVRAAAKISAGGMGSPLPQTSPSELPVLVTTVVKVSSVE